MSIQAADASSQAERHSSSGGNLRNGTRLIIILILISPLLVRTWFVRKVPFIEVPFDVKTLWNVEVPDEDNAFVHYREAHRLFEAVNQTDMANNTVDTAVPTIILQVLENGWGTVVGSERLEQWIEARRAALDEWRRGTELPDAQYHSMRGAHWEILLPVTQNLRDFARMAECEAIRFEEQGDFAAALKWHLAVLRCGYHSGKRGFAIERLTGAALHSMAANGLARWSEYRAVTSEQLRQAIHEIQAAERMKTPISETLKVEYFMASNSMSRSNWIGAGDIAKGAVAEEPLVSGLKAFYWLVGEPYCTEMVLRHGLANQLMEVDLPLAERHPYAGKGVAMLFNVDSTRLSPNQLNPAAIERAVQRSNVATAVTSGPIKDLDTSVQRQKARQATVVTALAAQAYLRDHQEYPLQLEELVPAYLDAVPIDPTDRQGKAVRYRRDSPTTALIWSVGPDGKDETADLEMARKLGFGIDLKTR